MIMFTKENEKMSMKNVEIAGLTVNQE